MRSDNQPRPPLKRFTFVFLFVKVFRDDEQGSGGGAASEEIYSHKFAAAPRTPGPKNEPSALLLEVIKVPSAGRVIWNHLYSFAFPSALVSSGHLESSHHPWASFMSLWCHLDIFLNRLISPRTNSAPSTGVAKIAIILAHSLGQLNSIPKYRTYNIHSSLTILCLYLECLHYFNVSCQLKAPLLIKSFTWVYENDLGE